MSRAQDVWFELLGRESSTEDLGDPEYRDLVTEQLEVARLRDGGAVDDQELADRESELWDEHGGRAGIGPRPSS